MGAILLLYLLLVLAVIPVITWRTAAAGIIERTGRPALYRSALQSSWGLALLGGTVLWLDGSLSPARVGLTLGRGTDWPALPLWTVVTVVALAVTAAMFQGLRWLLGQGESAALVHVLPRTLQERRLFVLVAVSAGINEELVFRGIAQAALQVMLAAGAGVGGGPAGSLAGPAPWIAALLVSASFGLGHGYQRFSGMLRAGLLGLVLTLPLLATGSLLPGIVAHALLDLSAIPLGRRLLAARHGNAQEFHVQPGA